MSRKFDTIMEGAVTRLQAETEKDVVRAPSDSVVRERVARAIREDHQFTHEICRLEDGVGWSIPPDIAKCGHEH